MQTYVLRVAMWVLGLSALFGNVFVIILRVREKTKSEIQEKQAFLVANLAVSDCLMGVYMIILASVDIYYGDEYFHYSDEWRVSTLCKFESFLSLISSEASVFFITFITIDRFFAVVFPFSGPKFHILSTKLTACIIWIISFCLGVVPSVYADPDSDFYDLSDVCVGLPLITRPSSYRIQSSALSGTNSSQIFTLPIPEDFKPAWYFSIAIFLGINLTCFLTIMVCYIIMFINVRYVRLKVNSSSREDELRIAVRMAAIVGTDFVCWMPVILMGLLSQTGAAVIPLQMYTWSVVFIIPINSSLNPYLYTIASQVAYKRKMAEQISVGTTLAKVNNTKFNNESMVA